MASKYKGYENKRVNEVSEFKVPSSQNYLITKFEREKRECKGKRGYYYSYKLQLENNVWISTQTFNKYVKRGFFSKQVVKKVQDAKTIKVVDFDLFGNDSPFIEVKPTTKAKTSRLSIDELLSISNDVVDYINRLMEMYANASNCIINVDFDSKDLRFKTQNDLYNSWCDIIDIECENIAKDLANATEYDVFKYYHWTYTYRPIVKGLIDMIWDDLTQNAYYVIENRYLDDFKQLDLQNAKKLHKQLAKKFHTDNLETGNVELFKVTQNAYERYIEWKNKQDKKRQRKNKKTVLTQQTQQAGKLYLLA